MTAIGFLSSSGEPEWEFLIRLLRASSSGGSLAFRLASGIHLVKSRRATSDMDLLSRIIGAMLLLDCEVHSRLQPRSLYSGSGPEGAHWHRILDSSFRYYIGSRYPWYLTYLVIPYSALTYCKMTCIEPCISGHAKLQFE